MRELTIDVANEALVLTPERAVHWTRARTLIVADAHWGTGPAPRANADPAADAAAHDAFARLDALLARTHARRIVFLGDLLHTRAGHAPSALAQLQAWRQRHRETDMLLVRGNQDRHAADPPAELAIRSTDGPLIEPPFVLTHYPAPSAAGYVLAGHLHPAARSQPAAAQERLACFWFGRRVGVLPAFGDFTGLATIEPSADDRVYVIDQHAVRAL